MDFVFKNCVPEDGHVVVETRTEVNISWFGVWKYTL